MILLEVRNLRKVFGGLAAVKELSFNVENGNIVGLIGPNGAGKTTIYNLITGFLRPTSGDIYYNGYKVTHFSPHKLASMGIIRTFQETNIFKEMTVLENVLVAHQQHVKSGSLAHFFNTPKARKDNLAIRQNALEILDHFGIIPLKDEKAKNLPHGHQRILEIAIALAGDPKLLLLDEPFTGMNALESQSLIKLIMEIRNRGVTIIIVEHNMKVIMSLSDRIVAISFGQKIAEGTPKEIQNSEAVSEAYLGTEEDD
jgi:branched-chain amino acid transport system ATP-binding protein